MSEQAWSMSVENGLSAHFKMPDGPSREGTIWSVHLRRSDEHYVALVKGLLAPDATKATRNDSNYQSHATVQYLNDQLNHGWHPRDQMEHTIDIGNPPTASGPASLNASKPWWQFW